MMMFSGSGCWWRHFSSTADNPMWRHRTVLWRYFRFRPTATAMFVGIGSEHLTSTLFRVAHAHSASRTCISFLPGDVYFRCGHDVPLRQLLARVFMKLLVLLILSIYYTKSSFCLFRFIFFITAYFCILSYPHLLLPASAFTLSFFTFFLLVPVSTCREDRTGRRASRVPTTGPC